MTRYCVVLLLLYPAADSLGSEALRFSNDGLALSAEVFMPDEGESLPGIVLIQGSGPSGTTNGWARQFAERFADRGYAVLLPDKRGVGKSDGNWRTAGFEALAADAIASLRALEAHPRVVPGRVGFLGLSQGGHIAPLAARQVPGIPFVINAVGSLVVMEQQLYHELRNAYLEHGLDDATIAYLQTFAQLSFAYLRDPSRWHEYLAMRNEIAAGPLARAVESWPDKPDDPYWIFWGKIHDYDPLPHWRELAVNRDVPCLVLYGSEDEHENVPVAASRARAAPLEAGGAMTVRVYPGSGHALFAPGTRELRRDMIIDTDKFLRAALLKN